MLNSSEFKVHISNLLQWAQSGTKLTYASIAIGLVAGLVLFRLFFQHLPGFIHCVGFSVSTGKNPDLAKQPSLGTSSRLKLLLALLLPVAFGFAAYLLLPKLVPAYFQ
jgi:hypothetical protein